MRNPKPSLHARRNPPTRYEKINIDIQNTISNVWEYLDKYIEIIEIYWRGYVSAISSVLLFIFEEFQSNM